MCVRATVAEETKIHVEIVRTRDVDAVSDSNVVAIVASVP